MRNGAGGLSSGRLLEPQQSPTAPRPPAARHQDCNPGKIGLAFGQGARQIRVRIHPRHAAQERER
jgi:hypothetical protein